MTPQYRLDILRSLALPRGTSLHFRYGEAILPDGLRTLLDKNAIVGAQVLLAYVDCSFAARRPDGSCPITPCRHASLVSSKTIRTRYFLELRLEEFAPCSDLEGFQISVSGNRPHWVGSEAGAPEMPVGHWYLESGVGEQACSKSAEVDAWEGIVALLKQADAFRDEQLFFTGASRLTSYPFYWAALGEFEFRRGRHDVAREHFRTALARARNPGERRFLEDRLAHAKVVHTDRYPGANPTEVSEKE